MKLEYERDHDGELMISIKEGLINKQDHTATVTCGFFYVQGEVVNPKALKYSHR